MTTPMTKSLAIALVAATLSCASGTPRPAEGASSAVLSSIGPAPVPRQDVVTENFHGKRLEDEYRWMESVDKELEVWARESTKRARAFLDGSPSREDIRNQVRKLFAARDRYSDPELNVAGTFLLRVKSGANRPALVLKTSDGAERVLFDGNSPDGGAGQSIDSFASSPDGRFVVVALSTEGKENTSLHVIETATGKMRDESIDRSPFPFLSWLPDSSGFFYSQSIEAEGSENKSSHAKLHLLAEPVTRDRVIFARSFVPDVSKGYAFAKLEQIPGTRILVGSLMENGLTNRLMYFSELTGEGVRTSTSWKPFVTSEDAVAVSCAAQKTLFAISRRRSNLGEVVAYRWDRGKVTSDIALPAGSSLIQDVAADRSHLYAVLLDGSKRSLVRRSEQRSEVIKVEDGVSPLGGYASPYREGLIALAGAFWIHDRLLMVDAGSTTARDAGFGEATDGLALRVHEEKRTAVSKDGTAVPYTILLPDDGRRQARPTMLIAYGAYGLIIPPQFSARYTAWLQSGGAIVIASVRGGGELGEGWHLAATKQNKHRSVEDLHAVAEALVSTQFTTASALGLSAGSAGGLTAANAVLERPELFAAVVLDVPFLNATRLGAMAGGPANFPEFGSPEDESEAMGLLRMDAYHNIRAGARYPAMLLTGGWNDPRILPWQLAKFAARLNARAKGGPFLLAFDFDAGHGFTSTTDQDIDLVTDELVFFKTLLAAPAERARSAESKH